MMAPVLKGASGARYSPRGASLAIKRNFERRVLPLAWESNSGTRKFCRGLHLGQHGTIKPLDFKIGVYT